MDTLEVARVGASRRNEHTEVVGSIAGVGGSHPEAQLRTIGKVHLRRNEVFIRVQGTHTIDVGTAADGVSTTVVPVKRQACIVSPSGRDGASQAPSVTVVVGVDNGPAGRQTTFEVNGEGITLARYWRHGAAAGIIPSDSVAVNGHAVHSAGIVLARLILPHALCIVAHASAVHSCNLADVLFSLDEFVGSQLAERIHRVGVEDRLVVDAFAQHLVVLEVTVAVLGTAGQGNVVNPDLVLVVILVVEGNPYVLASVGTQVNAV